MNRARATSMLTTSKLFPNHGGLRGWLYFARECFICFGGVTMDFVSGDSLIYSTTHQSPRGFAATSIRGSAAKTKKNDRARNPASHAGYTYDNVNSILVYWSFWAESKSC